MCEDAVGDERFKVMERKLYHGIMTPSMVVVVALGGWLLYEYAWVAYKSMLWLHIKLAIGLLLIAYHLYCGHLVKVFRDGRNRRSHLFYRWFNEAPVLALVAMVVWLVSRTGLLKADQSTLRTGLPRASTLLIIEPLAS